MKSKGQGQFSIFLFLISPLVGLITSMFNYRAHYAKNLLWAFIAFYGLTMVVSNSGIDASRYRDKFLEIESEQPSTREFVGTLFQPESGRFDILQPSVAFIVSKFTRNFHIQFAVFGLIFGFFYSRNIWGLIGNAGGKLKYISILFLFAFCFVNGFWNISGFRFWTAAHIYFYGAFLAFNGERNRGTLFILFSGLAHFGFWIAVAVWFVYLVLGNRLRFYFLFFIVSLTVSELDFDQVRQLISQYSPAFLEEKLSRYTNESYLEVYYGKQANTNWYVQGHQEYLKYAIYVFTIALYFLRGQIKSHPRVHSFYCFSLLILGFGNIMSLLPSGGRYLIVANLFAMATLFLFIQKRRQTGFMSLLVPLSIPILLLFCIVKARISFDTVGVLTVFGNPLVALITDVDTALIDLIK